MIKCYVGLLVEVDGEMRSTFRKICNPAAVGCFFQKREYCNI